MKIISTYVGSSAMVHTGKCYFIGVTGAYDVTVNNVEVAGSAGTGNQIAQLIKDKLRYVMLPKPGVECSNGLYVAVEAGTQVYWSLG